MTHQYCLMTIRPMRRAASVIIFFAFAFTSHIATLHGQETEPRETSITTEDDSTETEEKEKGENEAGSPSFLPIPVIITEPAIGVGLGVALTYFHKKKDGDGVTSAELAPALSLDGVDDPRKEKKPPPTVTAVAGAYTDNGTWAGGIGHMNSWREDTIRYTGALAYANVNSTFYRFNLAFDFGIKGGLVFQDLKFRIGQSNFFLGGKLSALAANVDVDVRAEVPPFLDLIDRAVTDVGLALQGTFDTRDNTMTPTHGQYVEASAWRYDEAIGGDYGYWKGKFKFTSFHQLHERLVLGWRVEGEMVDGRPPFWAYPWVSIRGIPAMRYQNERTAVVEVEGRYNFAKRWGAVAFIGRGRARGDNPAFDVDEELLAGGVGGRWLFKEDENLWIGIDVARGPEDTYWYIQVGQAW